MGHLTPLYDTLAGPTAKAQARAALNALLSDGNTVFDYQPGGQVSAGGLVVDSWTNAIGPAPQLAAAGAARPIWLPAAPAPLTKYGYLPGVAANNINTPDSASLAIIGDIDMDCYVALNDWTPTTVNCLIGKDDSGANREWQFSIFQATGVLSVAWWDVGGVLRTAASTAAPVIADASPLYARWVLDVDNGAGGCDCKFYTSPNGIVWTQLGATVTQAFVTSVRNQVAAVTIGEGGAQPATGKFYNARIFNGIRTAGGILAANWNAQDWPETATNGATAVSSTTGEVWTLNNTGALPAQIVGSPSTLFDGVAQQMSAIFAFIQPEMIYWYGKQVSWANGKWFFDGITPASGGVQQVVGTPTIQLYAGNAAGNNATLPIGQYATVSIGINGAASFSQVNNAAKVIGNAGAGNCAGITLGAAGGGAGNWANTQVKEMIARRVIDSAAVQAQIMTLLNIING